MVIQYLSSDKYVYERRFRLPRGVNGNLQGYEIDGDLVRFFSCDENDVREFILNRWIFPKDAKSMGFLKMDFSGKYHVGAPGYYDNKGNLLKMGNR